MAETKRMMKSMAELPLRNELPAQLKNKPVIVSSALSSATSDVDSLRSHELRLVSTDLRSRIKEQEQVLESTNKQEQELETSTVLMEQELRDTVEEAERFHQLYREEMKRKLENKAVIEAQKKDISRNFFITAELSRPNSRPGTRGTPKNLTGQRRIESAVGRRHLGGEVSPPNTGLLTRIVKYRQNPATLGGRRSG